jgi:hypothetical protein
MKTTVTLDDALYTEARVYAIKHRMTFGELIAKALKVEIKK